MSGIKKTSFARFFDTFDSIGSVVPIERLSKTMFFDSRKGVGSTPLRQRFPASFRGGVQRTQQYHCIKL
nr:hypothetical protein [uncultured Agathobaculum sp.]